LIMERVWRSWEVNPIVDWARQRVYRDEVIAVCMNAHARLDRYGRSSERWHVGDAWAQRGDEGRGKLR
jgi:hypothetical protein